VDGPRATADYFTGLPAVRGAAYYHVAQRQNLMLTSSSKAAQTSTMPQVLQPSQQAAQHR
jgi:hypothetical protein